MNRIAVPNNRRRRLPRRSPERYGAASDRLLTPYWVLLTLLSVVLGGELFEFCATEVLSVQFDDAQV